MFSIDVCRYGVAASWLGDGVLEIASREPALVHSALELLGTIVADPSKINLLLPILTRSFHAGDKVSNVV